MSEEVHHIAEQVETLFINMGAEQKQAQFMAKQLLKRASQIAAERKISNAEALEILLKQVIEAHRGP